jgi:hypothetical protein
MRQRIHRRRLVVQQTGGHTVNNALSILVTVLVVVLLVVLILYVVGRL